MNRVLPQCMKYSVKLKRKSVNTVVLLLVVVAVDYRETCSTTVTVTTTMRSTVPYCTFVFLENGGQCLAAANLNNIIRSGNTTYLGEEPTNDHTHR
jgi:hypothetical protein